MQKKGSSPIRRPARPGARSTPGCSTTPAGARHRRGKPSDVAAAAPWLASDAARFVTGHNLMVDGGWMAY